MGRLAIKHQSNFDAYFFLQAIIPTCTPDLIWIKHANHKKRKKERSQFIQVSQTCQHPIQLAEIEVLFLREDA